MKILAFNSLYYPYQIGGAEKSVQLTMEAMVKLGHDCHIITLTEKQHEILGHNRVVVHTIRNKNIYWASDKKSHGTIKKIIWHLIDSFNPLHVYLVARKIKEIRPDVIWTNNLAGMSVSIWVVAKILNVNVVHTLRDYYLINPECVPPSSRVRKIVSKFFSFPKKLASLLVDEVVGISDFLLNEHVSSGYFKNAKKSVIYNPINRPASPLTEKKAAKGATRIGYFGRISAEKGVYELINRFNKDNNSKGRTLIVAGGGVEQDVEHLKGLIENNSTIDFIGHTSPEAFFRLIDVLIVPSLWDEPFGRVVIEALSYNKPVIVNPVGGLTELSNLLYGVTCIPIENLNFEQVDKFVREIEFSNNSKELEIFLSENVAQKYINRFG